MSAGGASAAVGSKRERRRSGRGVVWDEGNLEANEAIKAAMQPIKINEPKTPYHGPSIADDSDGDGGADMLPLTLEEEDHGQASVSRENSEADRMEQLEARMSPDFDVGPSSSRRTSVDGGSPGSYYSSEDEGQKAEKRRKFEEHRKKHYQMSSEAREALHRTQADELAKSGGSGNGVSASGQAGVEADWSAAS